MQTDHETKIVQTPLYFIYDGECPICQMAADLYRLRQNVGRFETIDARISSDHSVVQEINAAGLDLDEGMVIKYNGDLYQGDKAFRLMAQLSERKGWFNRFNKALAVSDTMSKLSYPIVKGLRNTLIKVLGVGKIKDMEPMSKDNSDPIFKPIFQDGWRHLPPVMYKHYANRPYSDDTSVVEGTLNVMCKWYLKPMLSLLKSMPPVTQKDVPVTVTFTSQQASAGFGFERVFQFDGRAPLAFNSRMFHRGGSEIMELMSFGICWHANYKWDGKQVTLTHKGYSWRFGNRSLKLPVTWLIGRGDAFEIPVDDNTFDMSVTLSHPILGKIYGYEGRFTVVKEV